MKTMLKVELKELVEKKIKNTQERLALKRIPFSERTTAQHNDMLWHWSEGSVLKENIRYIGLAYALVRGRRYWVTERYTKKSVSARSLASIAGVSEEAAKAWLDERPTEEEQAAYARHLQEAKEKAAASKLRRSAA